MTSTQESFALEPTEDPLPGLRKLCVDVVNKYFGERLRDYELHVVDTTDPRFDWAPVRSSFLVRIVPRGGKRSIGNMSFNYYYRDKDKLGKVRTRLLARLEKYCCRIAPRFRTQEQLEMTARRRAAEASTLPGRIRKLVADADRAFEELEKTP